MSRSKLLVAVLFSLLAVAPAILCAQSSVGNAETRSAATNDEAQAVSVVKDESVIHAKEIRYERFFVLIIGWEDAAQRNRDEGAVQVADLIHNRLQKNSRITEDQAAATLQVALQWEKDLRVASRNVLQVIAAERASHPDVHLDHTNSPRIRAAYDARWRLTSDAILQLQTLLGAQAFAGLDKFTYHVDEYNPSR